MPRHLSALLSPLPEPATETRALSARDKSLEGAAPSDSIDLRFLALLVCAAFLGSVIFHLASAWAGHSHYRDLHLGTAATYAQGHIDLLRPVIVGFNANGSPTPQEVPLWQALAACVFKVFGPWFGWANLLSLLLFATGLWPFYSLSREYLGMRGAWWALLFLLTQPLLVVLSGQASADGLSFVLALWFFFFTNKLVRSGNARWTLPAILFGALSAVTKVPLYLCAALASCLLLLLSRPKEIKTWLLLFAVGIANLAVFAAWTRHTNACLAAAEFPFVDLRVSRNSFMWFWFFGDWAYRLNPVNWAKGGWTALNCLFGSFALAGLVLWGLLFSSNRLGKVLFAGACGTMLVFSHLVLVHKHYFILFSPAVALLSASAILRLEKILDLRLRWQKVCLILGVAMLLAVSAIQGLIGMEIVLDYDPYPHEIARIISEHTRSEDKLLIQGGGWGGEVLFLSNRKGLSIWNAELLKTKETRRRLLDLGYNKLVLISESPLLHSLQKTNPGSLDRERISYRAALVDVARDWPTIFQSEDLTIRQFTQP